MNKENDVEKVIDKLYVTESYGGTIVERPIPKPNEVYSNITLGMVNQVTDTCI